MLEGYSDASWISDISDSKATSGYVFTLGGAAVSWKSSKQTVITRSTMESEFVALDKCGEEAEWLRNFLEDIPKWTKPVPAICIHCDNQSAINIAKNPVHHDRTKHVEIDRHFVKEKIEAGVISLHYIPTNHQIADILTKALPKKIFEDLESNLGLLNIYNLA